jgi:hypothetical protein
MLKHSFGLVAFSLCLGSLSSGCSSDSDEGGEPPTTGVQPPPIAFGGSGGGGTVVSFAGAGTSAGGASVFDGGTAPLTPEEAAIIRDDQCASWVTQVEVLPSMLQLVVDISSSMNQPAPGNSGQTRWDIARAALLETIVGVNGTGLPANVTVGMLLYPGLQSSISTMEQDPGMCVNIDAMVPPEELGPPGSAQRDAIREGIENANLLQSTPTHDAYRYALEEALVPARFSGSKFMLLITDGAPTVSAGCSTASGQLEGGGVESQPIVDEVQNAADNHDVRTFLIGVPGSEPNRQWMSTAAVIGGTAPPGCFVNGGPSGSDFCHMDMTTAPDFAEALRDGLNDVLGVVSPCSFSFAEPPDGQQIDPQKINVLLNDDGADTLIIRDDNGECGEGWQLTASNEILLCPDTCAAVQANPQISVDLTFGCRSFREPPIVE